MRPSTDIGRIVRDPAVLAGKPTIKGTRLSVELIVSFLDGGQTPDEIVDDFPNLAIADITAAIDYAAGCDAILPQ